MPSKFCFYIHHHGAGHVMRAMAIAESLKPESVTFMGSDLTRYAQGIPANVSCLHLPMDTQQEGDIHYSNKSLSFLHYAPLHASGLLDRSHLMVDFFHKNRNMILVVDVSVEVALLARLCGVPTVLIRQHGQRRDTAHRIGYESAALIIAPFPKEMDSMEDNPYFDTTLYAGGFSRYTATRPDHPRASNTQAVGILLGQGGSNIDVNFLKYLRKELDVNIALHVIGTIKTPADLPNTQVYGHVESPAEKLAACDVVICNAGHNTIMELADLGKRMICIPAARPFDEQVKKAAHLEKLGCAVVIPEQQIYQTDWASAILEARQINPANLKLLTSRQALSRVSEALNNLYNDLYTLPLNQLHDEKHSA